jgi:hypothetical protein
MLDLGHPPNQHGTNEMAGSTLIRSLPIFPGPTPAALIWRSSRVCFLLSGEESSDGEGVP